jgi:hypothetical protein
LPTVTTQVAITLPSGVSVDASMPVMVDGMPIETSPGAKSSVTINDVGAIGPGQQKQITMSLAFSGLQPGMADEVAAVLSFTSSPAIPSQYSSYTVTKSSTSGSPPPPCVPGGEGRGGCDCRVGPAARSTNGNFRTLTLLFGCFILSLRANRRRRLSGK